MTSLWSESKSFCPQMSETVFLTLQTYSQLKKKKFCKKVKSMFPQISHSCEKHKTWINIEENGQ